MNGVLVWRRGSVVTAAAVVVLALVTSTRGQGLSEDFNGASGTGGATVFSGAGYNELNGWDDNLVGEWAFGGTFGDGTVTAVDAAGSTSAGVGGSGAGVLTVSGATYTDGGWYAGLFWPGVTPPVLDPASLSLTAEVYGSVDAGDYQLRLEGYKLIPFGLNENFDNVVGKGGSAGHTFFDSTSGATGAMENWDEGIDGEAAFAGIDGGGTVTGGATAVGVVDGGVDNSGAGRLTVTDITADPGGHWYAGLSWGGQQLPTTDLALVELRANIKGETNGGTLGDYMLRIEDQDKDYLAFKMTSDGSFQDVGGPLGGPLSTAVHGGIGLGDDTFNPLLGPFIVVVVFDNDTTDTWGSGGILTVDNLQLTGGITQQLVGSVTFDGVADGVDFQPIGGKLNTGASTLVNVNEDFEDVVGPGAGNGVFFDSTSGPEGYTPNWDDGIVGEEAFAGIYGAIQVTGDARVEGLSNVGDGGGGGARLTVTGMDNIAGNCELGTWWAGISWPGQQLPPGELSGITMLARVKGTAVSGSSAGSYTLRLEDADGDYLVYTLPSNGQFRTVGGTLLNATEVAGPRLTADGVFDRDRGPFTIAIAFENPCEEWGAGGVLTVDNVSLSPAPFGTGVDEWSVAVSFINEVATWDTGGTLVVDNLNLVESSTVVPPPLTAAAGPAGNRYLRIEAPGGGAEEAIRVKLVSLDGFALPSPDFLWVGPPVDAPEEDSTQPGLTFKAAGLSCTPHYQDWSTVGIINVYGAEIMPGSEYAVQRVDVSCADTADEGCYSAPLVMLTGKYGDVWPLFEHPDNPPQPDFGDIAALVQKFLAAGPVAAPIKAVAQLQPNNVFPDRAIDFRDIATCVEAFLGVPYAANNTGPCECPSTVTCGATPCTSDLVCGGGLCVDGFCGDACGRCAP